MLTRSNNSYSYGVAAEKIAADYISSFGFSLLASRYKTPYGEIDLIFRKNNLLLFVEVKARRRKSRVENVITPQQIARISAATELFLFDFQDYGDCDCRFDLVVLYGNRIHQHIKNISI